MAGMASEQIGILSIISIVLLNTISFYKKYKPPLFLNIAFIFFIGGWLCLYFSPGHANRANLYFSDFYMSIAQVLHLDLLSFSKRLYLTISNFQNKIIVLIDFLLLCLIFKKQNIKNIFIFIIMAILILALYNNLKFAWFINLFILAVIFLILSLKDSFYRILLALFCLFILCMLSTIQFPGLPHRARLGDSLILISIILLLYNRFIQNKYMQLLTISFCGIYALYVSFTYLEYRIKWNNMVSSIIEQKSRGVEYIEVENIFHSRYKNFGDWVNPSSSDSSIWPNPNYARYFEVKTFSVKK